ncbi:uncharacterized protein LOC124123693 [Haliotis rufescens]|uniref:uncharacterized protein LOC124123693 n=1 Tax=Haliotis rufescens TaxID=6454 RepID=UPI00201F3865|nr:uncharacterized protein LOC124123693 [Haliotis rufescens]
MNGFQSLFKIQSGFKATNGRSTLKPSLPTQSLPALPPPPPDSHHGLPYTGSDSSLVHSIAARFVLSASRPQDHGDVIDGNKTPQSKGGNPVRQQQLFATPSQELHRNPGNVETAREKPSVQLKRPGKDVHPAMSAVILGWLICQREMLKDLADMRSTTVKNHNQLLKNQESTQALVLSLVEQLQALQTEVTAIHTHTEADRVTLKRLVVLTGLVNLLLMFLALSWSNRSVRTTCHMWYGHLRQSVIHPALTVFRDYRNFTQSVVSQALSSLRLFKWS